MLLRRFTQHVNDQNWFAVVLDFFIVVSGVLVAFQLSTWGEQRAAEARAERSLHQLYEESEAALAYWVDMVASEDETLAHQDRAFSALASGTRGDVTDEDLVQAIFSIGFYQTMSPPRRTYDELSSAGLLREVEAPDAMTALVDYYGRVEFIQGQIEFFRPSSRTQQVDLYLGLHQHFDRTSTTRLRVEASFDDIAANAEYLETLAGEFRNRLIFQFYRRNVMHSAAEMCLSFAEAVGESCEALEVYEEWRELPEWQTRDVPNYGNPEEEPEEEAEEEE